MKHMKKLVLGYFPIYNIFLSTLQQLFWKWNDIYIVFLMDFSQFLFVFYYELLEKILESKAKGERVSLRRPAGKKSQRITLLRLFSFLMLGGVVWIKERQDDIVFRVTIHVWDWRTRMLWGEKLSLPINIFMGIRLMLVFFLAAFDSMNSLILLEVHSSKNQDCPQHIHPPLILLLTLQFSLHLLFRPFLCRTLPSKWILHQKRRRFPHRWAADAKCWEVSKVWEQYQHYVSLSLIFWQD